MVGGGAAARRLLEAPRRASDSSKNEGFPLRGARARATRKSAETRGKRAIRRPRPRGSPDGRPDAKSPWSGAPFQGVLPTIAPSFQGLRFACKDAADDGTARSLPRSLPRSILGAPRASRRSVRWRAFGWVRSRGAPCARHRARRLSLRLAQGLSRRRRLRVACSRLPRMRARALNDPSRRRLGTGRRPRADATPREPRCCDGHAARGAGAESNRASRLALRATARALGPRRA
jgi:hypothetical protein